MTDSIIFKGLRAKGRIGVTEAERAVPQGLIVDLELELDLGPPGLSDDLEDTIDYSKVTGDVARLIEDNEVLLLEHLAQKIADHLLTEPKLGRVTVVLGKERPPVPEEVDGVSVRIERLR